MSYLLLTSALKRIIKVCRPALLRNCDRLTDQSIDQPTDQTTNQPTDRQTVRMGYREVTFRRRCFMGFRLQFIVAVCLRDVCTNTLAIYSYMLFTREYYAGDVIYVTCEPTFSCKGTLIFFWPIASPSSKLERAKRLIPHPQTIQHFCFPPVAR